MLPNMNPRQMEQAMRRAGISQQNIDATEVIIRLPGKEILIRNPSVARISMMGQQTYQVAGKEEVRETGSSPEINEEDVKTVMEQAGCDEQTARRAIADADGDLAQAILNLADK